MAHSGPRPGAAEQKGIDFHAGVLRLLEEEAARISTKRSTHEWTNVCRWIRGYQRENPVVISVLVHPAFGMPWQVVRPGPARYLQRAIR